MTFSKISEENGVLKYSFDHVDHSEKYGYIGQIRFTREDEFGNAIMANHGIHSVYRTGWNT